MYIALKKENYIAKFTLRYLFIETFFNLLKKLDEKKVNIYWKKNYQWLLIILVRN